MFNLGQICQYLKPSLQSSTRAYVLRGILLQSAIRIHFIFYKLNNTTKYGNLIDVLKLLPKIPSSALL